MVVSGFDSLAPFVSLNERLEMYDYDPELPAGFQEADFLQAELEAEANRCARLRRRGICTHGWQLGRRVPAYYDAESVASMRRAGTFPDRPSAVADQAAIPVGQSLCLNCGSLVGDRVFEQEEPPGRCQ